MTEVKTQRLRRGWTQMDLGFRARIQPAEISRIETGRLIPTTEQIRRLAKALKTTPGDLAGASGHDASARK